MEVKFLGRRIEIRKGYAAVAIVFLLAAACMIGFTISKSGGTIIFSAEDSPRTDSRNESTNKSQVGEGTNIQVTQKPPVEEIKVYVVGCVKSPGVVTLVQGKLIDDAIKAAGGATAEADLENINLAYEVKDNEMVKIKAKQTVVQEQKEVPQKQNLPQGSGVEIIQGSGGAVAESPETQDNNGGKVNLNTATIQELDALPGIGEATAGEILAYREKSGGFKKIEDIMKVSGIKEARFNAIKELITVQ